MEDHPHSTERNLPQWSVQQGGWVTLPTHRGEMGLQCLESEQDSLVIMGGYDDAAEET